MANGDIGACLDIERNELTIQGNIYKDSFVDIWKNRFEIFRQDKAELNPQCKQCSEREFCMGDSTHTWNFQNNEPNYCVFKMLEGNYAGEYKENHGQWRQMRQLSSVIVQKRIVL